MDGKKVYQIQINGISESISAVEALNKQLQALENKIKELEKSSTVNVKTQGGGNASALSEEEAIQKEINKLKQEGATLDAKIVAAQDEVYKKVDATKQLYKETIADQKAIAAQERLTADAYSNTMQGMKSHLADLKAVINTTDMGDTEKIKQMTQEANELTNKLKEMEEAYGQFGRNVGNYQDAANGFKGIAIQIGDVTQKFDNAKQAAKTLKTELATLQFKKDKGLLLSEEEVKRFEELPSIVAQLQSSIQDAGKPMDNLLDSMQSLVAVMQSTKGISAFFGLDNTEVEKSIQRLVALQNAMQGLQTIQKQIKSREGIGAWIAPFNSQIDKATTKMLAFNTALLGTGKTAKVAAAGINVFGKALKAAVSAGIIIAIELIIDKIMDLIESYNKVDDAVQRTMDVEKELSRVYTEASANILKYKTIVENFNGTQEQEKKLVEQLNSELGNSLGKYKNIAEWKDALIQKSGAYIQMLVEEAKAQKLISQLVNLEDKRKDAEWKAATGGSWTDLYEGIWHGDLNHANKRREKERDETLKEIDEDEEIIRMKIEEAYRNIAKIQEEYKIGILAEGTVEDKKTKDKTAKEMKDAEADLIALTIQLMDEGWLKRKAELVHERDERIRHIEESGKLVAERTKAVEELYNKTIAEEEKKWANERLKTYQDLANNIADVNNETFKMNQETKTQNLEIEKNARMEMLKMYANSSKQILALEEKFAEDSAKIKQETLDKDYENAQKEEKDRHDRLVREGGEYAKMLKEDKITKEQYDELIINENKAFTERMKAIDEKYHSDTLQINQEALDKKKKAFDNHYSSLLNSVKNNQDKLAKEMGDFSNIFGKFSSASNSNPFVGIAMYGKSMDKLNEFKQKAQKNIAEINNKLAQLEKDRLKMGEEAYEKYLSQYMQEKEMTENELEDVERLKEQLNHILIDAIGDLATMITDGVFENMDIAFEKEQEEIDKANDELDKALDKQQEIVQQHKDAIDSIEDELANSRGDRRAHLIDQLNAEIEAKRAAAAEEKRLEKQKEEQQRKQDNLDKERKKAEYKSNIAQIIISGAMAVANGYATQPAWVGLALGPLMAALTAAQLAIALANKPYAKGGQLDGGVAQGKRHSEGGIPVLGGRASIEGGEFITNRQTTANNVDLLEYINAKHRKLNIDDFIDFYSSGKIKKNITSMSPRAKFADGGVIPTLNNDYQFDDRLLSAFEDYSNRPVYVSVVDINSRQAAVKNVQVLAGLE